jgi:hypothetical protein
METKKGNKPDYRGDGVAVWVSKTKEGKPYLSIKLLGSISTVAWLNEDLPKND